jgi:hypothetical protein
MQQLVKQGLLTAETLPKWRVHVAALQSLSELFQQQGTWGGPMNSWPPTTRHRLPCGSTACHWMQMGARRMPAWCCRTCCGGRRATAAAAPAAVAAGMSVQPARWQGARHLSSQVQRPAAAAGGLAGCCNGCSCSTRPIEPLVGE